LTGGVPDVDRLPWWPEEARTDRVETVIRENYAVEDYRLPEEPAVDAPTLLLTGERGPDHLRDAIVTLHDRLPDSRLVELDGVGHVGTREAPGQVADAVRSWVGTL
jgi:pimeloyl-ACP methyl ester carboxylesterase